MRAHSWWAVSPVCQTGPNRGPAASAQGQKLVTSPTPGGQQAGTPGQGEEVELDQGSVGKSFTAGHGRLP